ncbi:UDP-N-acetyl-D-mannosaminouronate:lipid I N-acetyl-D-mannosaminouronosyltransferase [Ruegeria intermedia]|uniref:UDP-N-acetyl-D-mannosaminouronate:lipid I N-acetyl-D-mannosaminouronosyltransferase n=1 Tax=Ruegeria intermedia TaxID=996115 RepID=A0A1M4V199_9RHOB|nr:WecB/TagA/CpsF family glycosyltransferase [Ruegeria intermedia]SHE62668.1 UDP-N-acetyl-D-mannosaminouronate:lipid I N-acetyl-D-mannosaminouronosyltransferase [Ruegeria intermedia]
MNKHQRHHSPLQSVSFVKPAIGVTYFKSLDEAADFAFGTQRHQGAFIAMNAEKMVSLYQDPSLFSKIRNPIYYPDGSSMLWFVSKRSPRIPGVELWLHILERSQLHGGKVLVIGATADVSKDTEERIGKMAPNLTYRCVDGFRSEDAYFELMEGMKPDVVFVAMGSPRQEILIARLQVRWPDCFYMGVGGSLDVLTGNVVRAPEIYRQFGIEFLYRLLKEPRRIFRQRRLLVFVYLFLSGKFGPRLV